MKSAFGVEHGIAKSYLGAGKWGKAIVEKSATLRERERWGKVPGTQRWDIIDEQGRRVGDTGVYPKKFGRKPWDKDHGVTRWDHGGVGDTTIKPKYRGKGYSTDARRARIQQGKHKRIYSPIDDSNIASIRSAEKAGAKPIRHITTKDGTPRTVYLHKRPKA